ncbi:MAG TPA: chemotaxis protein CheB [Pseudoxanthomonas sp.]|nr:chemotaxis protein CheB [Pseudoxanthomonas sp.]
MDSRIIALGASAGGVEALSQLVAALPSDLAASVLVVLHVSPDLPSHLPQILARSGDLPACHATDGAELRNGQILVAPPDRHMSVHDGKVRVWNGSKENRQRPSIDVTLRSVAVACGPRAIGAVLSGALDDGVAGMEAIVRSGGRALVQVPAQARHPYLPQNVIDAVPQAEVLTLEAMARRIVSLVAERVEANAALFDESVAMGRLELKISARMGTAEEMNRLGMLSGLTCPECGGAIIQVQDTAQLRYRCHTGHGFTATSLFVEQSEQSEKLLWQALQLLRENAQTTRFLIDHVRKLGQTERVRDYRAHLDKVEESIDRLHQLVTSPPLGAAERTL